MAPLDGKPEASELIPRLWGSTAGGGVNCFPRSLGRHCGCASLRGRSPNIRPNIPGTSFEYWFASLGMSTRFCAETGPLGGSCQRPLQRLARAQQRPIRILAGSCSPSRTAKDLEGPGALGQPRWGQRRDMIASEEHRERSPLQPGDIPGLT